METETSTRLESVSWLAAQAGEKLDEEHLLSHEQHARFIHEVYGILPTIGCEIEVKWSALFPELAREYFGEKDTYGRFEHRYQDLPLERQQALDEQCKPLDESLKRRYETTLQHGIPAGSDAYWEFANKPTYSWQLLAKEVQLLMKQELIPIGFEHALHVTLGGVAAKGGGMCLVLSGLELLTVSPERILLATKGNHLGTSTGWARRGDDGIRSRGPGALALGQSIGTEMRTLHVSDPEHAAWIFASAQTLGAVLLAYRKRNEVTDPAISQLASLWPQYRGEIKNLWQSANLLASSWGPPHRNPEPWQVWAETIRRREDEGTMAYQACQAICRIIDQATIFIELLDE